MKTVSFVIPVYNPPEERLRALLESVLSQEGVGLEVVAVNDGSTNNAPAILREFEAANPGKMIVVDRRNAGEGPSRNEGFRHATGDYVWFVDADDLVRPGAAAYLADALERTGADQILFGTAESTFLEKNPFPEEWTGVVRKTTALAEIAGHCFSAWRRLSRRSFLERVGVRYCNAKTGCDAAESLRWDLEARSLVRVDDVCYKYFIRPDSVSHVTPGATHFSLGWQVMDLFAALRAEHPDYSQWLDLWNYVRARGHLSLAERYLAETDLHSPDELDAVRSARAEYRRRFDALDAGNPLVILYDFARAVGRSDLRGRLLKAQAEAKQEKKNAAAAKRKAETAERRAAAGERKAAAASAKAAAAARRVAAMERSLSWRLTAPLRAVLRPFAGGRG